jgi:hypothetical protein
VGRQRAEGPLLASCGDPGIGFSRDDQVHSEQCPVETSLERLVQMQRQRFWIERSFEDAKSESGLADYQVRGWRAWHHHMALVLMAMLFMLEEKLSNQESYPLLSCSDIEVLLAHFLPRRDVTVEEIVRQMEVRHEARRKAIEAAYRRQ